VGDDGVAGVADAGCAISLWRASVVVAVSAKDTETQVSRAFVEFDWKADTRPLHQLIDSIRATNSTAIQNIANAWLSCALAERDVAAAQDALIAAGENPINLGRDVFLIVDS
jgi:hypothetical protein